MINDSLDCGFKLNNIIFSGYHINFGVNFEINGDRRFNFADVKLGVIAIIRDFFKIEKMQFKQAINLGDLKYNILSLDGVVGIKTLRLFQNVASINDFAGDSRQLAYYNANGTAITNGESEHGFLYEMGNATVDDIVRPSATPAIFELRNPNGDIYGRVV
jgi:hypothetical protein